MQVKNFFVAGLLTIICFASCSKKNNDILPEVTIEGKWVGKSSVLSEPYNAFYSFNIKAGGLLETLNSNGDKTGEGTWALYSDGIGMNGTYTLTGGGTFSFIANVDKTNGKLDGTWGNGTKEYGGGYWYMDKVK